MINAKAELEHSKRQIPKRIKEGALVGNILPAIGVFLLWVSLRLFYVGKDYVTSYAVLLCAFCIIYVGFRILNTTNYVKTLQDWEKLVVLEEKYKKEESRIYQPIRNDNPNRDQT